MRKFKSAISTVATTAASLTLVAMSVQSAVADNATGNVNASSHFLADVEQAIVTTNNRYIIKLASQDTAMASAESADSDGFVMTMNNAESVLFTMGAKLETAIPSLNMVAATMTEETLNEIKSMNGVEFVEVDQPRSLMQQHTPYGITMVQAPQLPQSDTAARKVCVIDTGYDWGHDDLPVGNVSGEGTGPFVGQWWQDGNGHGTHVAGTIAAFDNKEGVTGVYPGVDLHIVKIFDDEGKWTWASNLIFAVHKCNEAGANVVNMSLGGPSFSQAESNALAGFTEQGILLVAAAGNGASSDQSYPASYDSVMSVAAVDSAENHAWYSQYNEQVEIAAPGSGVYSTVPVNGYGTKSGTSMATPHVAGSAALLWSYHSECSNEQIRASLNATTKDKGTPGRDDYYGHGIVQVEDAYDYLNQYGCEGKGSEIEEEIEEIEATVLESSKGKLTKLAGNKGEWTRYTWEVPKGMKKLIVRVSGGKGNADLYLNPVDQPDLDTFRCKSEGTRNKEVCILDKPRGGTWHIGLYGVDDYSFTTMSYEYR